MKDQFIPYEIAVQLKQLGFNQKCFDLHDDVKSIGMSGCKRDRTPKILWQQAFDWFRIEHKLLSSISQPFNQEYCFEIKNLKEEKKEGELSSMQSKVFTLYSDAKYQCLERLIQEIQSNLPF